MDKKPPYTLALALPDQKPSFACTVRSSLIVPTPTYGNFLRSSKVEVEGVAAEGQQSALQQNQPWSARKGDRMLTKVLPVQQTGWAEL